MTRRLPSTALFSLVFAAGALGFAAPSQAQEATDMPLPVAEPAVPSQNDPSAKTESAVSKSTTDPAARLSEIKAKGASAIAARQTTLTSVSTKLSQATTDCGSNAQMTAELSATSAGLNTVGSTLASSTELTVAKNLHRSIFIDYRVYLVVAPKAGKVIRCNTQLVRNAALAAEGAKLQASIDAAAAKGANVASAQSAKDAAMASLTLINPAPALSSVMGLVPDKGDKAVQAANAAALQQSDSLLDATYAQQKTVNQQFNSARKLLAEANKGDRAADKAAKDAAQAEAKAVKEAERKTAREQRKTGRTKTARTVAPTTVS
jgi:hypothetical protein